MFTLTVILCAVAATMGYGAVAQWRVRDKRLAFGLAVIAIVAVGVALLTAERLRSGNDPMDWIRQPQPIGCKVGGC